MAPKAYGQTVAVVDKSGKVISTSKTLLSVLQDARTAYMDKKEQIRSNSSPQVPTRKHMDQAPRHVPSRLHSSPAGHAGASRSPTFPSSSRPKESSRKHPDSRSRSHHPHPPPSPTSSNLGRTHAAPSLVLEDGYDPSLAQQQHSQLTRRHTDRAPSHSSEIDLALAYGSPPRSPSPQQPNDELTPLLKHCTSLLTEFHCLSHSVTHTIALLQKDPEALAAVALTLAEISNVASKMAPGALAAMKGSFPAVVALVCSPQFLIAAGVGAGVLVVGLGGYKIIKKIQEKRKEEGRMDEMMELGADVNRIEMWRRGVTEIGDVEGTESIAGTSVEGELITPEAVALKRGLTEKEKEKLKKEARTKAKSEKGKAKSEKGAKKDEEKMMKKKGLKEKKSKGSVKGESKPGKAASTLQLLFK